MLICTQAYAASASPPNIIFIFADDWGYGDMSAHGSDWIETPHLDAMAAEGIDFTIERGEIVSPLSKRPRVSTRFRANLFWLGHLQRCTHRCNHYQLYR